VPARQRRASDHIPGLLLAAVAAGPEAVPDPFGYLTHIALFARAALRTWPA
jgi:hypothetical protein